MTRAIADLGGTSRQSLATARAALDAALKGKNESEAAKFAAELFTALAALDASAPLRRALTDASRDAKDKVKLVNDLFAKGAGSTLALLGELASLKWSRPSDLANAVEQLAIEADMEISQVHRIEKGKINPTLTTLNALAKGLGITLVELVG